jgi:flagellin
MLSIRSNIASFDAQRNMSNTSNSLQKSMERLSSGFRINRAGDDAAGLAISEKLKAQVNGLMQAARNAGDGISMIQTAEAGLDEVQNMMQRIRELAVEASNDTLGTGERENIAKEVAELHKEMQNIADRTKFNNLGLLNGSLTTTLDSANSTAAVGTVLATNDNATISAVNVGKASADATYTFTEDGDGNLQLSDGTNSYTLDVDDLDVDAGTSKTLNFAPLGISITVSAETDKAGADLVGDLDGLVLETNAGDSAAKLQTGANAGEETELSFVDVRVDDAADLDPFKDALDAFEAGPTQDTASDLLAEVDDALNFISTQRATLGAGQNRLEHSIASVKAAAENLEASNSRIRDVDVAEESGNLARSQILMQAGVSVLAQANQIPQMALKLLG